MRPDLLDAEAAIDWALAQLDTLNIRIISWKRDKPYSVRIDTDSEPGKKLYRLCNIKPLDPFINAEAGAIIHSIRSSLDLLACALAVRNDRSPGSTYFPIWKSEADFLAPPGKKPNGKPSNPALEKIERLSQVNQDIIKSLRPYPGPNGNPLLCALHDLDLTRKHRRLLDTFVRPRGIGFDPGLRGEVTIHEWRSFKEETVLCTTSANQPDSNVSIGVEVAFDEAGPMHGVECTTAIRDFARMTKDIVCMFVRAGT